ncbi:LOW QUALITY PROTEIN: potassium channel regulatory protein [Erethizon dorsatum]
MSCQELVTSNVGGKIFTMRLSTINQFPAGLAHMLDGRDQFKMVGGQIFVDRDSVLFSFILDFLRTHQLLLPIDFSDYFRLQREALFCELNTLVELLNQHLLQPRPAVLEVHFLSNTQAFCRVFGSCSKTVEMLNGRITVFIEQPAVPIWSKFPRMTLLLPPQRPSYHDLVFHCGSDSTAEIQNGIRYFDILLKKSFHLVSTKKKSSEDKSKCYSFAKIKSPEALAMNKTGKPETTIKPGELERKK